MRISSAIASSMHAAGTSSQQRMAASAVQMMRMPVLHAHGDKVLLGDLGEQAEDQRMPSSSGSTDGLCDLMLWPWPRRL